MSYRTVLFFSRACIVAGLTLVLAGAAIGVHTNSSTDSVQDSKSLTTVQPIGARDCGAVSLFVIARFSGNRDITLDYLRNLTSSGQYGTTMYALKVAAEHIGFVDVQGRDLSVLALARRLETGQFAILHVHGSHFVSAIGLTKSGKIVVLDGVQGATAYEASCLAQEIGWSGKTLVLGTKKARSVILFQEH